MITLATYTIKEYMNGRLTGITEGVSHDEAIALFNDALDDDELDIHVILEKMEA